MFARLVSPQSDWRITQVPPRGIFDNRLEPFCDESDLIAEIAGWNLRNTSHFIGSASSNDATKWRDYRAGVNEALCDMEPWRRIILSWHLMEEYVETRLLTIEEITGSAHHVRLVRNSMPDPNSMLTIWEFFGEHADQLSALLQHYTAEIQ